MNAAAIQGSAAVNVIAPPPYHGIGGSGILGSAMQQQAQPTLADRFKFVRGRVAARAKVLEYIEAQLNMDLFKGDQNATTIFEEAMLAALEKLK